MTAKDETYKNALSKGAELLSFRALSRKELFDKLVGKGFPPEAAEKAVSRLCEISGQDDAEYAQALARRYQKKCCGAIKIRHELKRRGIDDEIISRTLEKTDGTEEILDAFISKKAGAGPLDRAQKKKIADALTRRGFSYDDIASAMQRFFNDTEDDGCPSEFV